MSTLARPLEVRRRMLLVALLSLLLGAVGFVALYRVARNLARSASIQNRTDQALRVIPIGMSPDGPVLLPLEPPASGGMLTVAPGDTGVFRYRTGVANFCWLLIAPPQGPMRILDSRAGPENCRPGVPPSSWGGPPAAEYFIEPPLEKLPPAPPELVRVGERGLAEQ